MDFLRFPKGFLTLKVKGTAWKMQNNGGHGQEDPPEEEMATHSSILAWRSPWIEEPRGHHGVAESNMTDPLILFTLKRRVTLQILGIKGYLEMFRE